jgi:hypothetical protein
LVLEQQVLIASAPIAELDEGETDRPSVADFALLDSLPFLALNPADAPEPLLRRSFEIMRLDIRIPRLEVQGRSAWREVWGESPGKHNA